MFIACTALFLGLTTTPSDSLSPPDSLRTHQLTEIVVSASRLAESSLRSAVSVGVLDIASIRQSAQPSYFDAIENLKGVQVLNASLGFKVYNTRGFANPTNVRFVQLVDGRDNQAPHIGAPIANALAPSDLDIRQVELIPGTASALYGMNALNGLVNLLTKNPFTSPGLSISQKIGINHLNESGTSASAFSETSLRYVYLIGSRWAIKLNMVYQTGQDWIAKNANDLNPNGNATLGLFGADNPASDPVNSYGNESANRRTLTLGGKRYSVARTGYFEQEVADYTLRNLRGDASIWYKISTNSTLNYTYQGATLDNVYQRTNRFRLEGYRLDQHSLTYSSPSLQLRLYHTRENTGSSYNLRSMAENIDKGFKSNDNWFADFSKQFTASVGGGAAVPTALQAARAIADLGRPQPGTTAFADQIAKLRDINNWDIGAALRVKTWMYHAEGQWEPTRTVLSGLAQQTGLQLLTGFDAREYVVYPDGNYFINPESPANNLIYTKAGAFIQAGRSFFGDKLRLTGSIRGDKNAYFDSRLNPRLSAVWSPSELHHVRFSYQNGYRFPSLFEAFSNVNSGGVKRVGGLPLLAQGIFERSYFQTAISQFQAAITADVNNNKLTTNEAIQKNKGLLKANTYTYIKPEQVNSVEIGYKGLWFRQRLYVDIDAYYNVYHNFIAQVNANIPKTTVSDSIPYYLADPSKQDNYRLWTNSATVVHNYGASLGLRYAPGQAWVLAGNASLARLDHTDNGDGLEEAFNTPQWITNVSVSNPQLIGRLGFSLNYKYQSSFLWQSSLATGTVPAIHNVDAQASYSLAWHGKTDVGLQLKAGATNLLNRPYYTFVAGPSVGGFYYTSVVWTVF